MTRNNADFQGASSGRPAAMSARDIMKTYRIDEVGGSFERQQTEPTKVNAHMDYKYKVASTPGANGESLKDSIVNNGFDPKSPLKISHYPDNSALTDGHHRLAVMLKHFPDTPIPLRHVE